MTEFPLYTEHFITPIIVDRLNNAAGIAMLEDIIRNRKISHPDGKSVSNIGGWHSDTDMVHWGGEAARALVHKVITMADKYSHDISQKDGQSEPNFDWTAQMWANVSEKGNMHRFHTHPGAYWSAVAYINDGRTAGRDENVGGRIMFQDPRMPMMQMTAPNLRFGKDRQNIENGKQSMQVETGMVIMFPSWLNHAVEGYSGAAQRISIAINLIPVAKVR